MADGIAEMRYRISVTDQHLQNRLKQICAYGAQQLVTWAKTNARWTDDTGFARGSLHAGSYDSPNQYDPGLPADTVGIYLAHGAPYGIWLEVRWHGRFAIILLSIETVGPQIMQLISAGLLS